MYDAVGLDEICSDGPLLVLQIRAERNSCNPIIVFSYSLLFMRWLVTVRGLLFAVRFRFRDRTFILGEWHFCH